MRGRSGRGGWVLLLLFLALVTWAVAAPTWVSAGGTSVLTGTVPVRVAGTRAAPGMVAAALALGAAGAALALAGRVGRWMVVTVVAGCGVLVAWSAAGVLVDPVPAARQAVAVATGVDHVVQPARTTAAPWVALVVALLVVGCAVALGRVSARWAGPSRRHELRTEGRTPDGQEEQTRTSAVPERSSREAQVSAAATSTAPTPDGGASAGRTIGVDTAGADRAVPDERPEAPDERADWDALSRGEDPT